MQPQKKGFPAPEDEPGQRPLLPQLAPAAPQRRRRRWLWAPVVLVVLVGAAAYYFLARQPAPAPGAGKAGPTTQVRTVKVFTGGLERTVRLTGTTAADKYASLIAPQLRGARHGMSSANVAGSTLTVPSSSSRTSSRSTSGSSSSSSTVATVASSTGASDSSGSGGGGGGGERGSGASASNLRDSGGRTGGSSGGGGGDHGGGGGGGRVSMGSGSREAAGAPAGGGGRGPAQAMGGSEFSLVLQELVQPGSRVKKGQVVAEFDRQYMLTRLDDYRATVEQHEAGLRILKANLDVDNKAHAQSILVAKAELDKARIDLKTLPVRADIDSERLKLAEEEAAARYKQLLSEVKFKKISQAAQWKIAEVNRDESKIELGRAEANADKMMVRAPMDGVTVMAQTIRSGEFGQIQQGDSVSAGQMFMRVVDPDSMTMNASINQVDSEMIRLGARAKVRFDAYPELELPAHVYSIGAIPRQGGFRANYVKEVAVVLKLDKLDPRVIPDLSVSADVVLASEEKAAIVPLASIFREEAAGKPFAFLKAPSGWERREVELGLTNNVAAVIRTGLAPGEVVAAEWPAKEKK